MHVELGCQTAILNFKIYGNSKNWENVQKTYFFKKIQDFFLIKKKRKQCLRTLANEYVYKISSLKAILKSYLSSLPASSYLEKRLGFAVLNAQRPLFMLFTRVSAISDFQLLSDLGHPRSVLGPLFSVF